MGNGAQMSGDGWKLDFGGGHDVAHTDVDCDVVHLKLTCYKPMLSL